MKCNKLLEELYSKYDSNDFSMELFPKNTITARFKLIQISHFAEPGFFKSFITTRIKLHCKVLPRQMEIFDTPGDYEAAMNHFLSTALMAPVIFNKKIDQYIKNEVFRKANIKLYIEDGCPCTFFRNNMKTVTDEELYFNVTIGLANMMLIAYDSMITCRESEYKRKIGSYKDLPETAKKIEVLHGYKPE